MPVADVIIGFCGVCCNHCGMRARVPEMARSLKRFIDAYEYAEWIRNVAIDFDFDDLMKGLDWFANSGCPGCLKGGGMPRCEVRACCLQRGLKNCYFCGEFSGCEKLGYQKETEENYDNIQYLEKRKE